jgi:glucose-1-phosphate thymidylyltransferase
VKGIILAGGTGSRLWPSTLVVSKQLLPIYDKPMIYYPLSTLMMAGIREVLVIVNPRDLESFSALLGNGAQFGIQIHFAIQEQPKGLAQALIIAENFLCGEASMLILGDNLFHGDGLGFGIQEKIPSSGCHIFVYEVSTPSQYGVLTLDEKSQPIHIEEKPLDPKSNLAVTGLYFFDGEAPALAKEIRPSLRGELEITDLIQRYLDRAELTFSILSRGSAWLDTGNSNSLHDASTFVRVLEERTNLKIACPEEIAWRQGWISTQELIILANNLGNNSYSNYLKSLGSK